MRAAYLAGVRVRAAHLFGVRVGDWGCSPLWDQGEGCSCVTVWSEGQGEGQSEGQGEGQCEGQGEGQSEGRGGASAPPPYKRPRGQRSQGRGRRRGAQTPGGTRHRWRGPPGPSPCEMYREMHWSTGAISVGADAGCVMQYEVQYVVQYVVHDYAQCNALCNALCNAPCNAPCNALCDALRLISARHLSMSGQTSVLLCL